MKRVYSLCNESPSACQELQLRGERCCCAKGPQTSPAPNRAPQPRLPERPPSVNGSPSNRTRQVHCLPPLTPYLTHHVDLLHCPKFLWKHPCPLHLTTPQHTAWLSLDLCDDAPALPTHPVLRLLPDWHLETFFPVNLAFPCGSLEPSVAPHHA